MHGFLQDKTLFRKRLVPRRKAVSGFEPDDVKERSLMKYGLILVLAAYISCLAVCSTAEKTENLINDSSLDNRLAWESMNASIAEGTVQIQSPDGVDPGMVRQVITALKPDTHYKMSATARALNTPTSQLSVDLFIDESYDSPDQELVVMPMEIGPNYTTFHRIVNTGSFTEQPYIRIFTLSTVPVEISDVSLIEVG